MNTLMFSDVNFSNSEHSINMDTYLEKNTNINNNWSYRQYLMNNASTIMKLNHQSSMNNSSLHLENNFLPASYFNSDLKNNFISKEEEKNKTIAPIVFKVN